jgi:AraC family transcriptional regulator
LVPSLEAHRWLKASMQLCSWNAGWRSLLLRGYEDKPAVEEFTTAVTPDQLFVLVTAGSCRIECLRGGRRLSATYGVGSLAMKAPRVEEMIRWDSHESHSTLQLHLPSAVMERQIAELWDRGSTVELPSVLATRDPLIETTMIALRDAVAQGLPDLYAETAAEFLAAHLLLRHCRLKPLAAPGHEDRRLQRAEEYMRAHLGEPISLAVLAREAGLSRFHLLRLFKSAYGETPLKRLTRMRIGEAKRRLASGRQSITEIALDCGYENVAHFSTAFRRVEGISPSAYRRPKPSS